MTSNINEPFFTTDKYALHNNVENSSSDISKFYLNPRQRMDGTHALKLNIHMNNTTMRKDIGIEVPKKIWDAAKQQILGDYNGVSKLALNNALLKHKSKANNKLFELTQSGEIEGMTAKQFCKKLAGSSPITTKLTFNQYFNDTVKRFEKA